MSLIGSANNVNKHAIFVHIFRSCINAITHMQNMYSKTTQRNQENHTQDVMSLCTQTMVHHIKVTALSKPIQLIRDGKLLQTDCMQAFVSEHFSPGQVAWSTVYPLKIFLYYSLIIMKNLLYCFSYCVRVCKVPRTFWQDGTSAP